MLSIVCSFGLLIAVALVAMPARAEWPPTGVPLCANGCGADLFRVVADGSGGAFILWRGDGNQGDSDIFMQHVTSDGTIAPGWPANGLQICVQPFNQLPWGLISDGQGGVIALWDDRRTPGIPPDLYAQRVRADGTLAPGWIVNGNRVCDGPGSELSAGLASDGLGGAFIAWEDNRLEVDAYAQHLLGDGTRAPGWPSDGLPISTVAGVQAGPVGVISDDTGGAFIVWYDGRRGGGPRVDVYAQRIDSSGAVAPGWTDGGVLVMPHRQLILGGTAASDGSGGFIVGAVQIDSLDIFHHSYWAQRFLGTGMPAHRAGRQTVLLCAMHPARATACSEPPTGSVDYCSPGTTTGPLRLAARSMLLAYYQRDLWRRDGLKMEPGSAMTRRRGPKVSA